MKPIARKPSTGMNDTERKFADHLYMLQLAGEIKAYMFEPQKFTLVRNVEGGHNAVTYTPDFMIVHDGHFEYVDVKAKGKPNPGYTETGKKKRQWTSMRDDARVKMNMAAEIFKWYEWSVYYYEQGKWTKESVSGKLEEAN